MHVKFWLETLKETDHLEYLNLGERFPRVVTGE
jgi:hypothetical protein